MLKRFRLFFATHAASLRLTRQTLSQRPAFIALRLACAGAGLYGLCFGAYLLFSPATLPQDWRMLARVSAAIFVGLYVGAWWHARRRQTHADQDTPHQSE